MRKIGILAVLFLSVLCQAQGTHNIISCGANVYVYVVPSVTGSGSSFVAIKNPTTGKTVIEPMEVTYNGDGSATGQSSSLYIRADLAGNGYMIPTGTHDPVGQCRLLPPAPSGASGGN